MYDMEFQAALATSHISPYTVKEVIAGWVDEGVPTRSGFVVSLNDGHFAYITNHRDFRRAYVSSSTQTFIREPVELYERGARWVFDKEVLNSGTAQAKSQANYPTGGLAGRANPGEVVRIPI